MSVARGVVPGWPAGTRAFDRTGVGARVTYLGMVEAASWPAAAASAMTPAKVSALNIMIGLSRV